MDALHRISGIETDLFRLTVKDGIITTVMSKSSIHRHPGIQTDHQIL